MLLVGGPNGHCALCLYIKLQTDLDFLYEQEFPNCHRCDNPDAVVFPMLVPGRDSVQILWTKCVSWEQLSKYTRKMIDISNKLREPGERKDPNLYNTHSMKVGGGVECCLRRLSMHESQQFTGHVSPKNFALYAQLLGKFDACDILIEMQTTPLYARHDCTSTRKLQELLINAADTIQAAQSWIVATTPKLSELDSTLGNILQNSELVVAALVREREVHVHVPCPIVVAIVHCASTS